MTLYVSVWRSAGRAIITDSMSGAVYTYHFEQGLQDAAGTNLSMFMQGFGEIHKLTWVEPHPFPTLVQEFQERRRQWMSTLA